MRRDESRRGRQKCLRHVIWGLCLGLATAAPPAEWTAALDRISAASLRGHLSFIASDLLEGRNTPSRGLDVAAEYIAAQFRRAGLEAAGDDGYFQTANMMEVEPEMDGFQLTLRQEEQVVTVAAGDVVLRGSKGADIKDAAVFRAGRDAAIDVEQVRGRVVITDSMRAYNAVKKLNPAAILHLQRGRQPEPSGLHHLVEAEDAVSGWPVIGIVDAKVRKTLEELKPGLSDWKVSLHVNAARTTPAKVRNVIGVMRGSDAALKDTYVLLTAHYDHVGLATSGEDRVFNGANDDGSGTVSVIEIGAALAALPRHPRRSIMFMAFFGEEEGMLGSRYYARHPVVPLKATVADVNLEQVGRTDATEGPQIANGTFTGFEYSDLPATFVKAGEMTGIKVYSLPNGGNEFFDRSDNASFVEHGIVAHTAVVAAEFPDYHGVGDEWQKIDYENMAKVDRMLALGVLMIADNPVAPKWNREKAGKYIKAQP